MSEWQPIATAPRDGRSFLITDGVAVLIGGRSFVCTGEMTESSFWHTQSGSGWDPNYKRSPTHWMPLPNPPQDPS
jgi:hypothetical protein